MTTRTPGIDFIAQLKAPPMDGRDAIDGYPVDALLANYLATTKADPASTARMTALVKGVLERWISGLTHAIEGSPPATPEVFNRITRELRSTRAALIEIAAAFDRLTATAVQPAAAPRARHTEPAGESTPA